MDDVYINNFSLSETHFVPTSDEKPTIEATKPPEITGTCQCRGCDMEKLSYSLQECRDTTKAACMTLHEGEFAGYQKGLGLVCMDLLGTL